MQAVKLRITFVLGAIVAAIILGYAYYRSQDLIAGPRIFIESPQDGATVEEAFLPITGTARNIAHLSLNGRTIYINEAGEFSERALLSYGYNVVALAAKDRFGRTTEETLELIYK